MSFGPRLSAMRKTTLVERLLKAMMNGNPRSTRTVRNCHNTGFTSTWNEIFQRLLGEKAEAVRLGKRPKADRVSIRILIDISRSCGMIRSSTRPVVSLS
jgi:uncharacterized Fe-S center protein